MAKNEMERTEDTCKYCGGHVGFGIRALHIRVCDKRDCQRKKAKEAKRGGAKDARAV